MNTIYIYICTYIDICQTNFITLFHTQFTNLLYNIKIYQYFCITVLIIIDTTHPHIYYTKTLFKYNSIELYTVCCDLHNKCSLLVHVFEHVILQFMLLFEVYKTFRLWNLAGGITWLGEDFENLYLVLLQVHSICLPFIVEIGFLSFLLLYK